MSDVTNVILLWGPEDGDDPLTAINAALAAGGPPALVSVEDPTIGREWYGGTKYLECGIALGAVNYLDVAALVAAVRAAPWDAPGAVQLLIRGQDDEQFHFVPLDISP